VALAGTSDNVDCHNEVFVQIGFECMVVPVNNDLNTDTGGGEAHAVPCWQFPLELHVEKELAQKRERQKRKRPEKQKTPSAERNAKWRKKETNVEKELAPKREKRTAAKKKPASSAEQSADWCNKEGMIWPKL